MQLELYREIYEKLSDERSLTMVLEEYASAVPTRCIEGIYHRKSHIVNRKRICKFDSMNRSPEELLSLFLERLESCKVREESQEQEQEQANEERKMILVSMAKELYQVPPCYLARLVLKAFINSQRSQVRSTNGDDLGEIDSVHLNGSNIMEDPHHHHHQQQQKQKNTLNPAQLFKTPRLIGHQELAENVDCCHQMDQFCSPSMDEYRLKVGLQYEAILEDHLRELKIPYLNENSMRKMGYARTPDAVLLEPIAIAGTVVKWIESKAWFGDPDTHLLYLRDQYWPYYNRFGPGLVIYWFGFVEEAVETHQESGVAVLDAFPDPTQIARIDSPMLPKVDQLLQGISTLKDKEGEDS